MLKPCCLCNKRSSCACIGFVSLCSIAFSYSIWEPILIGLSALCTCMYSVRSRNRDSFTNTCLDHCHFCLLHATYTHWERFFGNKYKWYNIQDSCWCPTNLYEMLQKSDIGTRNKIGTQNLVRARTEKEFKSVYEGSLFPPNATLAHYIWSNYRLSPSQKWTAVENFLTRSRSIFSTLPGQNSHYANLLKRSRSPRQLLLTSWKQEQIRHV